MLDRQIATTLPIVGGTLTGSLTLASGPINALSAATRAVQVDSSSGNITGVINVMSAPLIHNLTEQRMTQGSISCSISSCFGGFGYLCAAWRNESTEYLFLERPPYETSKMDSRRHDTPERHVVVGGNSGAYGPPPRRGMVVGNSDVSAEVSRGASQATDFALSHSAYIVNHTGGPTTGAVAANARSDTIIYNSPNNYIWAGIDSLVWCGVQTGSASAPAQHVARYVQTMRESVGQNSNGTALPQPQLWGMWLQYRDTTAHSRAIELGNHCGDGLVW